MTNFLKYLAIALPILWTGCNDKETESLLPPDFDNGVFITNEGNFGEGDGSLFYYDLEEEKVYNNVFSLSNPGKTLGDVVQSINSNRNMIFIIVNNSNKVEALLTENLALQFTMEDLSLPRYMTNHLGNGYVSEWVSFSDPGRVSVIDLVSGTIENTITTDYGAEGLMIADNKLFVSNNFSTTVSVIDLATEEVIKTLTVGSSPGLFVTDSEGDLWVVCAGGLDDQYKPLGDGKLLEIDPVALTIKKEIDLGMNVSSKIAISPSKDQIYYFSGTSLYGFGTTGSTAPTVPLITNEDAVSFYGIGVDGDGLIYLSDSKSFAENGEVYVYNSDGTMEKQFTAGRGPNGFLFN